MTHDLYLSKGESMPGRKRIQFQDEEHHFTEVVAHLSWAVRTTAGPPFDLDVCVFPVTEHGKVPTGRYCIYYNNLITPDQAIQLEGDDLDGTAGGEIVRVHLRQVSAIIQRIVFAVGIYNAIERHEHFGNVSRTTITFTAEGHGLLAEHRIAGNFAKYTGVVVGEMVRTSDHWEFHPIDKGYYNGFTEIGHLYGVDFKDVPPA